MLKERRICKIKMIVCSICNFKKVSQSEKLAQISHFLNLDSAFLSLNNSGNVSTKGLEKIFYIFKFSKFFFLLFAVAEHIVWHQTVLRKEKQFVAFLFHLCLFWSIAKARRKDSSSLGLGI